MSDKNKKILRQQGIEVFPEGEILDLRWVGRQGDWYALTDKGWHWWDTQTSEWRHCPLGPL